MGKFCKRKGNPTSRQTNYFIVSGHPFKSKVSTLQVDELGVEILNIMDYVAVYRDEKDKRSEIENELCWAMWDVGILFTTGSGSDEIELSADSVERIVGHSRLQTSLTPNKKDEIMSVLRDYGGPRQRETKQLIRLLQNKKNGKNNGTETTVVSKDRPKEPEEELTIETLYDRSSIDQRERQLLESIVSEYQAYADEIDGRVHSDSYEQFVLSSIRTFEDHPNTVSAEPKPLRNGDIGYVVSHKSVRPKFYVRDCWKSDGYEFIVAVKHPRDSIETVTVSDGELLEHGTNGSVTTELSQIQSWLSWVVPNRRQNATISNGRYVTGYDGRSVEIVKKLSSKAELDDIVMGTINDISNSKNPLIRWGNQHMMLDEGQEGETVIVEQKNSQRGRVVSKVP